MLSCRHGLNVIFVIHRALVLVHGLRLVVLVDGVLFKDLLPGHVQTLEEEIGLDSSDHVVLLL